MAKLSKKTIKELQRLGLDTDWPSENVAQFHIKNAQRIEKAERMKRVALARPRKRTVYCFAGNGTAFRRKRYSV